QPVEVDRVRCRRRCGSCTDRHGAAASRVTLAARQRAVRRPRLAAGIPRSTPAMLSTLATVLMLAAEAAPPAPAETPPASQAPLPRQVDVDKATHRATPADQPT